MSVHRVRSPAGRVVIRGDNPARRSTGALTRPHGTYRVFMDALSPAEVDDLHSRAHPRRYARGVPLFYEFEAPDHVVTLLQGRVKVTRLSEEGREVLLAVRGPGDV